MNIVYNDNKNNIHYDELISEPSEKNTIIMKEAMNLFVSSPEIIEEFEDLNRIRNTIFPYDFSVFPDSIKKLSKHDIDNLKNAILNSKLFSVSHTIFMEYLNEQIKIYKEDEEVSDYFPIIRIFNLTLESNVNKWTKSPLTLPWTLIGVSEEWYAEILLRNTLEQGEN